jgi:hypothetical protein
VVRVIGNSIERVILNDISDVIYYRQQKEYTDQEFARSRDLDREIKSGKLIKIEAVQSPRNNAEVVGIQKFDEDKTQEFQDVKQTIRDILKEVKPDNSVQGTISINDVRGVVTEVLAEKMKVTVTSDEIKKAVTEVLSEFKRDLANYGVSQSYGGGFRPAEAAKPIESFVGPEYIPTINTSDMKSSVKGEERVSKDSNVSGSLDALKRLKNK